MIEQPVTIVQKTWTTKEIIKGNSILASSLIFVRSILWYDGFLIRVTHDRMSTEICSYIKVRCQVATQ